MHTVLDHAALTTLSATFNKLINTRSSSLPVLHHVRFEKVSESDVQATATTLEETLVLTLPGAVHSSEGSDTFLFPFAELKRLDKQLKKGDHVILEPADASSISVVSTVSGQRVVNDVPTMPVEEFPQTLRDIAGSECALGAFLDAYRTALPFASRDEKRQVLNGVFWHAEEQSLAATDGGHLVALLLDDIPLSDDVIIPPSKLLKSKVLCSRTGTMGVLCDDDDETQHLELDAGSWRYQVKCTVGRYPDYRHVIPAESNTFAAELTIGQDDLPLVKTAAAQFCDDSTSALCIYADADTVLLMSTAVDEDGSRGHVALPNSSCATDSPIVREVNAQFLLDGLEAGFTTMRVPADTSPWRCSGSVPGLHVFMPLCPGGDAEKLTAYVNETVKPTLVKTQGATQSGATPAPSAKPKVTAKKKRAQHAPKLTVVGKDPLQEFSDVMATMSDVARQANATLRELKTKAKAVERFIKARERHFAKSEKVLTQLQQVVNF